MYRKFFIQSPKYLLKSQHYGASYSTVFFSLLFSLWFKYSPHLQCGPTSAQQISELLSKHELNTLNRKKVTCIPNATHKLQLEQKFKKKNFVSFHSVLLVTNFIHVN